MDQHDGTIRIHSAPARDDPPARIVIGDLCLDLNTKTATRRDRDLELSVTEFSMLQFRAERPDRVQSRLDILKGVWAMISTHRPTSSRSVSPICARRWTRMATRS